jgi:hypothetical protein
MAALDEQLLKASTELLAVKIRLGLVNIPTTPVPIPGDDDTIFKPTTVRQAWERRLALTKKNGEMN